MTWIILNIVLLMVGIGLLAMSRQARVVDEQASVPEDILGILEAMLCAGGIVCLAFLIVSEPLRWWLG